MYKSINYLIFFLVTFFFLACGSSSDSDNQTTDHSGSSTTVFGNADVTDTFGVDGNLYKPVSDESASGLGNLVVLLSSKYSTKFDTCKIRKNTGDIADLFCLDTVPWTQVPFSCFSNGNRQTWRANFKCSSVGEVRVLCQDSIQSVEFVAPNGATGNVCTRFG